MSDRKIGIGIVVTATLIAGMGLWHHEWWRDEARTWLLMQSGHTLGDIWNDVVHGHPHPYYVLNYLVSRLFPAPIAMSVTNLAIMLVAIALFASAAPFTRLQKWLFAIGFFPLYQYGIIARSYTLFLALLFLYCHLKRTRPDHFGWRAITLIALAQVHIMSAAIVPVLLAMEWWQDRRHHHPWTLRQWSWSGLVLASILFCAWQVLSPAHHHSPYDLGNIKYAVLGLGHGFWPNYGIFFGNRVFEIMGIVLWGTSYRVFRGNRLGLLYYAALTATLLGISVALYSGYRWHHGFYFIYFIVALWLSADAPATDKLSRRFITGVLLLHALIGTYAVADDIRNPYSTGHLAAEAIRSHHLEETPFVGVGISLDNGRPRYQWEVDRIQPLMVLFPGHGILNPVTQQTEPYWTHYDNPVYFSPMSPDDITRGLHRMAQDHRTRLVVIVSRERGTAHVAVPPGLQLIAEFAPPSDYGEHLDVYVYEPS